MSGDRGKPALYFACVFGLLLCANGFTQETETAPPPPPPPSKSSTAANAKSTQDLVSAARASKAKRTTSSKSGKKVITNDVVKKSKGRLILISTSDSAADKKAAAEKKAEDPRSLAEQHEARIGDRKAAEARVAAAEAAVDALKIELVRAEQRYYESNDPSFRDRVLRARFDEVRKKLDDAMLELSDAREALGPVQPQPQP